MELIWVTFKCAHFRSGLKQSCPTRDVCICNNYDKYFNNIKYFKKQCEAAQLETYVLLSPSAPLPPNPPPLPQACFTVFAPTIIARQHC